MSGLIIGLTVGTIVLLCYLVFETEDEMIITDSTKDIYRPIQMELVVRGAILNALAFTSGDQTQAGKLLGLSTMSMTRWMTRLGIPRNRGGAVVEGKLAGARIGFLIGKKVS